MLYKNKPTNFYISLINLIIMLQIPIVFAAQKTPQAKCSKLLIPSKVVKEKDSTFEMRFSKDLISISDEEIELFLSEQGSHQTLLKAGKSFRIKHSPNDAFLGLATLLTDGRFPLVKSGNMSNEFYAVFKGHRSKKTAKKIRFLIKRSLISKPKKIDLYRFLFRLKLTAEIVNTFRKHEGLPKIEGHMITNKSLELFFAPLKQIKGDQVSEIMQEYFSYGIYKPIKRTTTNSLQVQEAINQNGDKNHLEFIELNSNKQRYYWIKSRQNIDNHKQVFFHYFNNARELLENKEQGMILLKQEHSNLELFVLIYDYALLLEQTMPETPELSYIIDFMKQIYQDIGSNTMEPRAAENYIKQVTYASLCHLFVLYNYYKEHLSADINFDIIFSPQSGEYNLRNMAHDIRIISNEYKEALALEELILEHNLEIAILIEGKINRLSKRLDLLHKELANNNLHNQEKYAQFIKKQRLKIRRIRAIGLEQKIPREERHAIALSFRKLREMELSFEKDIQRSHISNFKDLQDVSLIVAQKSYKLDGIVGINSVRFSAKVTSYLNYPALANEMAPSFLHAISKGWVDSGKVQDNGIRKFSSLDTRFRDVKAYGQTKYRLLGRMFENPKTKKQELYIFSIRKGDKNYSVKEINQLVNNVSSPY